VYWPQYFTMKFSSLALSAAVLAPFLPGSVGSNYRCTSEYEFYAEGDSEYPLYPSIGERKLAAEYFREAYNFAHRGDDYEMDRAR